MLKQPAFYIDMNNCTGCKACMIACTDKNDLPTTLQFRRISEYAGGQWSKQQDGTYTQNIFAYYISISCNHCENPICVRTCPVAAMTKSREGITIIDQEKCVGCRQCEEACPYYAPQFNAENEKMTKCDFCLDYLIEGKAPACVAACPSRVLNYGEYKDLIAKYGKANVVAPLPDSSITGPNLIFTPHRDAQPSGSRKGRVINPEEI